MQANLSVRKALFELEHPGARLMRYLDPVPSYSLMLALAGDDSWS